MVTGGGFSLKRGEMFRQWLDKWYGPTVGVISGYLFVDLSVISEVAEVPEGGENIAKLLRFFRFFKGDVLSPEVVDATRRVLRMFSNNVFLSPLLRSDLLAIVVVELDGSRMCVVGYGREKWLCIFKTREKEAKMIVANILSILGFSERTYEFSGTRILVEGLENWIKGLIENDDLEYAWVHNSFETGGPLPKDLNLIVKTVQNLFESPFFSSSLLFFLEQKSGRGVWCLRYHDKASCIFSGLGGESYNREMSEVIAEVYDCYVSGLVSSNHVEMAPLKQEKVECEKTEKIEEVKTIEKVEEEVVGSDEVITSAPQLNISEIKEALEDVKERLAALEGRVSAIEDKLSSLLTTVEVESLTEKFDERLKLIDDAIMRIRDFISDFSEKLQELRRHKNDLLKYIDDLSR